MNIIDKQIDVKNGSGFPLRCLIWGTGYAYGLFYHMIEYYEKEGFIIVCGVTSEDSFYKEVGRYCFVEKNSIKNEDYDVVIIMSTKKDVTDQIYRDALASSIDDYKLVPCLVMTLMGFDFLKYRNLRMHTPTIFSPNCWGGITYNKLGLRFESPLINMWETNEDYLRFLSAPKHYMEKEIVFREMRWEPTLKRDYPVFECEDILLHFNHYLDCNDAKDAWERRRRRINWNNLFVMFFDDDPETVERFLEMPFEKKKCFVPFPSEQDNTIMIDYLSDEKLKDLSFHEIIIGMAKGRYFCYNIFDLLIYNRFIPTALYKFG